MADWESNPVRRVDTTGSITTVAGLGDVGYSGDSGAATESRLHRPLGVAADSAGNVYVGEDGGGRVRKIDASGLITTCAATGDSGYRGDGEPATGARVNPFGVAANLNAMGFVPFRMS